jgi:hypothetical protein
MLLRDGAMRERTHLRFVLLVSGVEERGWGTAFRLPRKDDRPPFHFVWPPAIQCMSELTGRN